MQRNRRQIFFRFDHLTPPLHVPLTVRSVGHYQFYSACEIDRPIIKWFFQLFWITEGTAEFRLGDKASRLKAGDIFFHLPGERHDIRYITGPLSYRWLTFDHAEATRWAESFGLKKRPCRSGPCPEHLFDDVTKALRLGSRLGDRSAAHHAHAILLATLTQDSPPPGIDSPASRCKHTMDAHFPDPSMTVESIARDLSLHRSTLFRLFLRNYGLSPSRYLHSLRIRHAITLLQEHNLQIQEVATQSGFADANYFSRAIREATGLRPQDF